MSVNLGREDGVLVEPAGTWRQAGARGLLCRRPEGG